MRREPNTTLIPDDNELDLSSPGPGKVIIRSIISENRVRFCPPIDLSLKIERDFDGKDIRETIHINSHTSIDESDPAIVKLPLTSREYDSYFKIRVIDRSKKKVDYKLFVDYTWRSLNK